MADKSWKQFERRMGTLIGGKRYPANLGERVDIESTTFVGQCKEVKVLSLAALTELVEEMDREAKQRGKEQIGVVCVKLRRGTGRASSPLVVLSEEGFKRLTDMISEETNGGKEDSSEVCKAPDVHG